MTARYRPWNIWVRMILPVGCFLLLGVFLLLYTLYVENRFLSREAFLAQVRENTALIRDMHLPATARLAEMLGGVLQMDVRFIGGRGAYMAALNHPADGGDARGLASGVVVPWADETREAVKEAVDGERYLLFIRKRPDYWRSVFTGNTGWVVAGYFALSVLILGWLTHRVVSPLRELAGMLPHLNEDAALDTRAFGWRSDEVGLLARALQSMHERWVQEREGRLMAEKQAALLHLAAGFAHEVKNPVAGMKMHIQLLQSSGSDEERREAMSRLLPVFGRELNRVENLVNQWMYLVQPAPVQPMSCSVADLAKEATDVYRAMADYARVRIAAGIDPSHLIRVDRARMSVVFGNLIKNAIQAMPQGGILSIDSRIENGWVTVTFADTGAGFSVQALEQGTELFYSEREGGMGVGLTVSREMVESHGGSLLLSNRREARGGLVTVLLPRESGVYA